MRNSILTILFVSVFATACGLAEQGMAAETQAKKPKGKTKTQQGEPLPKEAKPGQSASEATAPENRKTENVKADTVVISYGEQAMIMGATRYNLGEGGSFTGRLSSPVPAGPVIVSIFRSIQPQYEAIAELMGVKVGGAYVQNGSDDKYKFIKMVDLALSDKELAAQFGLSSQSTQ